MYRGYDRGGKADEPGSFSFYIIYVFISIFFGSGKEDTLDGPG